MIAHKLKRTRLVRVMLPEATLGNNRNLLTAVFLQCAEEKETRDIVYENDGILPIIDLLTLKERNALAAATGAVWKCAQSEENAKRYVCNY